MADVGDISRKMLLYRNDVNMIGEFYFKDFPKIYEASFGEYIAFALVVRRTKGENVRSFMLLVKSFDQDSVSRLKILPAGSFIRVEGELETYNNKMYINAKRVSPLLKSDIRDLLNTVDIDADDDDRDEDEDDEIEEDGEVDEEDEEDEEDLDLFESSGKGNGDGRNQKFDPRTFGQSKPLTVLERGKIAIEVPPEDEDEDEDGEEISEVSFSIDDGEDEVLTVSAPREEAYPASEIRSTLSFERTQPEPAVASTEKRRKPGKEERGGSANKSEDGKGYSDRKPLKGFKGSGGKGFKGVKGFKSKRSKN